ncbi:alpha/beta hydrolase family protein [Arenimonas fontis]|nr:alpha/beta fold hydrolase [Arenimonas fontis]
MKRLLQSLFLLAALAAQMALAGPERLPVGDFFKDPEFTSVSLSPTGEYITVSVPQGDRTVLAAFKVDGMKLVGKWDYGAKRHIERVFWVNDERFLMFVSRKLGRFDFRVGTPDVYASNVDGTQRADMPNLGFYQIVDVTWDDPRTILVQRSIDSAFLSKYDVYDGRVTTVATAPLRFGNFIVNAKGEPRYVVGQDEKNNLITMRRDGDAWIQVHRDEMGGDRRVPLGFDGGDESKVVFEVSRGGKPATVVLVNPETGEETPLSRNPNVEPGGFLQSSGDNPELLAIRYFDGLPSYDFVKKDHPESKVYAGLINAFPDRSVSFAGISKDGRLVLLRTFSDRDPGSYFLFDRKTNQAKYLLSAMSWIDPEKMASMQPFSFKARDGRTIHGYITLPPDSDGGPLPMILHPHGGPHGPRDMWGFNPEVQFLANRGYAVLQVNFRGSGGYGSEFERAGYRNWGTAMIDDMTDAVDWAIARGIADKDRICTYGASYGGYAALQSVVRNPDKYRCTIGYVGVYSLPLMFKDGDIPDSESGRNYLERVLPVDLAEQQRQSPAFNVDRIRIPVMLVHGGKDERVPMSQYRLLKKNLEQAGRPPEVTVVEDKEGHGFYDYDNQVELYTAMEAFLDKHIGGKSN